MRAKNWLLASRLAISDTHDGNAGGVRSYLDVSGDRHGFIYPEITGYYLSMLRFLNGIEPDGELVKKCMLSADWLMKIHGTYGGIIQGISDDMSKRGLVYSFDTGVCAQGILDCYLLSGEKKYLDFAHGLLEWIRDEAMEPDGTTMPVYDLSAKEFTTDTSFWYMQKGCWHIKNVIPFCTLYNITKDPGLLDVMGRICGTLDKFQNADGSLSIHRGSRTIHMHSMCYALEGLLHAYAVTDDEHFLEACKRGLDWSVSHMGENGIDLWFNSRYRQERTSYHMAQLMRLMALVDGITGSSRYRRHAESLGSHLLSFQAKSDDPDVDGGFYECSRKTLLVWRRVARLNSWGSMFAIQAMHWLDGRGKVSRDDISFLY